MESSRVGIKYALASAFLFAIMATAVHLSPPQLPSSELVFARAVFSLVVLSYVLRKQPWIAFKVSSWPLWTRSFFGGVSVFSYFWTLKQTSVPTSTILSDIAPFFVILWSTFIPSERVGVRGWIGVLLALVGLFILRRPDVSGITPLVFGVGLCGAMAGSLAYLSLRQAGKNHTKSQIVWCFSAFLTIAAPLIPDSPWVLPDPKDFFVVGVVSLSGLLAQIALTESYRHLSSPVASTLGLLAVLFGAILEFSFTLRGPTWLEVVSYVIIAGGVLVIQLRKK